MKTAELGRKSPSSARSLLTFCCPFVVPRAHDDADHGGAAALRDVSRHEHSVKTTVKPAPELKRSPKLQMLDKFSEQMCRSE
jgi:hypothetical protein